MMATRQTTATTVRKKTAQGKERSDAALGFKTQYTSSPEGAKESGGLPRGWSEQRIEQLFAPLEDGRTLHQGWSPQCDKVPSPSEDVWGVLKTTSIQAGEFQPKYNKLLPSGLEPRPLIEVKEGDILLTCAGPRVRCGVSCLVRQTRKRLMMSRKMYRFRVDADRTEARYVEAFLQTERARLAIDKMKTGSSDSGLNLTHDRFRQLSIPVAPLPEQRRIVAEIEKQFTRLGAGVAALRRVQANLKRYRAAVLKAACEGRLVPTEAELSRTADNADSTDKKVRKSASSAQSAVKTPAYETGESLLARILTERRQNWQGRGQYKEPAPAETNNLPPIPEGWTWATVEQLSTRVQYGSSAKTNEDSSGVPVLRMGNIQDGKFDFDSLKYLPKTHDEFPELLLARGDLLFNRTNSAELVGKTAVFKGNPHPCSFASYLIRVRFGGECIPDFVSYFINSVLGRAWIADVVSQQVGQANVNGTKLQALAVPLPPFAEQTRIVAEVERRLSVVEELEAVVSTNLQRATRLRQSILQKASTGELSEAFGTDASAFGSNKKYV